MSGEYDTSGETIYTEAVDTDGDGISDTLVVDSDGDGYVDVVLTDVDGDGYADVAELDTNYDGYVDVVAADTDGDGYADVAVVDTDYDGYADTQLTADSGSSGSEPYPTDGDDVAASATLYDTALYTEPVDTAGIYDTGSSGTTS